MVGAVGFGAVTGALALPWLDRAWRRWAGAVWIRADGGRACRTGAPADPRRRRRGLRRRGRGLDHGSLFSQRRRPAVPARLGARPRARALWTGLLRLHDSAGALGWGALASLTTIPLALVAAAGLMLAGVGLMRSKPLSMQPSDLTPAGIWPEPQVAPPCRRPRPVMVVIEYLIDRPGRQLSAWRPNASLPSAVATAHTNGA